MARKTQKEKDAELLASIEIPIDYGGTQTRVILDAIVPVDTVITWPNDLDIPAGWVEESPAPNRTARKIV